MLVLESAVYEKQICQARSKYLLQINKNQMKRDKQIKRKSKVEEEELVMKRETEDLEQYEAHFKAKMQNFEIELQDLDAL